MTAADTHRAILAVWRIEQPRLITGLARMLRDVPLAEELTQEALLAALEHWPSDGVPERPGAWLMTAARRLALNHLHRAPMLERNHAMLLGELEQRQAVPPDYEAMLDDDIGDEMLRLIFTACHPLLPYDARTALALRMICGLTTAEIARAFLVPEATIAQRIVRAKRTLSESGLAYETPHGDALAGGLCWGRVVVFVIYNDGYPAAGGDDWLRPDLCSEALRLGRIVTAIAPDESEAHALLALMELNASRTAARTDAAGEPILLLDQDRSLWDQLQIQRGLRSLDRARELGGEGSFYALQAAIVACHARAGRAAETDWVRIALLYAGLSAVTRSPVVELNRAIALKDYHLLPSARGDLLRRLGRHDEARAAFQTAAVLAGNKRERDLLLRRASECGTAAAGQG